MSPGATMDRVYKELKAQVLQGTFAQGERLDPARLAQDLGASATPVRDALHLLAGEGLVDSRPHEGFRQPAITETELRDLFGWAHLLVAALLRNPSERGTPTIATDGLGTGYPERVSNLFLAIAALSENQQVSGAMKRLTDRLHIVRHAELGIDPNLGTELDDLETRYRERDWRMLRRGMLRFHRNSMNRVSVLAAALRSPPT